MDNPKQDTVAIVGRATAAMAWRIKRNNPALWAQIQRRAAEIEKRENVPCGR